jgi:hypothetical protein
MRNDGGSAFPAFVKTSEDLSKRDYFAGQALAGLMGPISTNLLSTGGSNLQQYVGWAYTAADAMLAEREKENEQ